MPAYTKEQLQQLALNAASTYSALGQLVQAGDPRILQQLASSAAMLAAISEQVSVAEFEPFVKARDGTVLADASLKGILPLGRACRIALSLSNEGTTSYNLAAGRRFQDAKGRVFEAEAGATIGAGGTAPVNFVQRTLRVVNHTVASPVPFYSVLVPMPDDGAVLDTLDVTVNGQDMNYRPDWFNAEPNELVYQVETDELRRLWVRLGSINVIGYGVQPGDVISLQIGECDGRITDLAAGAAFNFEYSYTAEESLIKASLASVRDAGVNAPTMAELRELTRYPAVYDKNAVYLGEFDKLLREFLRPIRFLAVWNEQIEEAVRGADEDNINTLFVSGQVTGMINSLFESRVRDLIARADDSYKVVFVPLASTPVAMTVEATVSVVHDAAAVEAQIRANILGTYGDGQVAVARGRSTPILNKAVSDNLRAAVPALKDEQSDFRVQITMPATPFPEHYLHVTNASLTVNVVRSNFGGNLWNYS